MKIESSNSDSIENRSIIDEPKTTSQQTSLFWGSYQSHLQLYDQLSLVEEQMLTLIQQTHSH